MRVLEHGEHAVVTHSGEGRADSVPVPYPSIPQPTKLGIGDLLLSRKVAQGVCLAISNMRSLRSAWTNSPRVMVTGEMLELGPIQQMYRHRVK